MHLRTYLVCFEIIAISSEKVCDIFLQDFFKIYVLENGENCQEKYKGNRKIEITVF